MVLMLCLVAIVAVVIVSTAAAVRRGACRLWESARSCYREPRSTSFWRWPTNVAYLIALWAVARLLTRLGDDLHAHPWPFLLFGLTLGLGLTLLEAEWDARRRA
jgi:hypothetical protein